MAKLCFGSDPEFMLQDQNGIFRSAIGIVPGNKYKPHKVGKNRYYYDNVMAECTVLPAKTRAEAIINFQTSFQNFAKLIAPHNMVIQASQEYPPEELAHKDALAIGCDREACVYALREIEPPEAEFIKGTLRSAGGHLHIGSSWIKKNPLNCIATIRMCDLFLGTMSIFLDKDKTSKRRKELYGKAGRFRIPPHGAEYRSLGNFWLASPKLVGFMYDMCNFIMEFLEADKHSQLWYVDTNRLNDENAWNEDGFDPADCHKCTGYDVNRLRKAIDTMDKKLGKKFLNLIQELMPVKLFSVFEKLAANGKYDFHKEWAIA
jgi:hypothetical protein